ncbi:MAG: YfhO family protein [Spirochaetota bacterium]
MWSFPPEEIADFAAPGLFGFYSGAQTHPYWGRMGFIEGKTSWNNFKHGTENAGLIAVVLALFAVIVFRRKEEWFWGTAALIVLIASFGRYFPPLFGAIYSLPFMESFRNPNKFIHIFTLALSVLSAFGFHYFVEVLRKKERDDMLTAFNAKELSSLRIFNVVVYALVVIGFFFAAFAVMNQSGSAASFAQRWGEAAGQAMAKNVATYAARFFFMAVLVASMVSFFLTMRSTVKVWEKAAAPAAFIALSILMYIRDTNDVLFLVVPVIASAAFAVVAFATTLERFFFRALTVLCVVVLAVDLWYTGQFFVITQDHDEMYRSNRIVRILEERRMGGTIDRTRFLSRNGILNHFVTHTFPKYGIPLFDAPAMRTMRGEYERFFRRFGIQDALQFHPRFYQLLNIRYLMSDFAVNSAFSAYITNLDQLPIGNGQTVFLYDTAFARPRFEMASGVYIAKDFDAALEALAGDRFDLTRTAVVYGADADSVSNTKFIPATRVGLTGFEYKHNAVQIRCASDGPVVVVVKDMYHPDWNAYVDGKRVRLMRANCVSMGVLVGAGEHDIQLKYEPRTLLILLWISAALWLLFIGGLALHFITEYRKGRG